MLLAQDSRNVWIAMHQLDVDALGHHEEARQLAEGSLGGTGFTDPHLGAKPTASPTVSRRERQLFLTVAGSLRMRTQKRPSYSARWEIKNCSASRWPKCVRQRKSVYGLIDVPRAWWERVETEDSRLKKRQCVHLCTQLVTYTGRT